MPLRIAVEQVAGGAAVEVDPRDRRLGALEDHVLGFLDVDAGAAQPSNTCASTPGRSQCRTTSMCVAGVVCARLTTFGTLPVFL